MPVFVLLDFIYLLRIQVISFQMKSNANQNNIADDKKRQGFECKSKEVRYIHLCLIIFVLHCAIIKRCV